MYIYNGQPFDITLPQIVGDTQYAPGWFFDADQRAAHGITEVADPAPPAVTAGQVAHLAGFTASATGELSPRWAVVTKSPEQLAVEAAALASAIAAAIDQCYVDTDAVTAAAVGNRTEEYRDAEADAREYAAAGYTGPVSDSVSAYAQFNPTGAVQTNQWAADNIIAKADAYRAAQAAMRAKRFEAQSSMRASTTQVQLVAAMAGWGNFIAGIRTALGV